MKRRNVAPSFPTTLCAGGRVKGAIGLSTTARRVPEEGRELVELVQWAAVEASALLGKER